MLRRCLDPQSRLVRTQILGSHCCTYSYHGHYARGIASSAGPTDQAAKSGRGWRPKPFFSKEEEDKIEAMLAKNHSWASIANALPGRPPRRIMDHYLRHMYIPGEMIEPGHSAKKTPPRTRYSQDENRQILKMLAEKHSWDSIATALPGRTAERIAKHYRRRLRTPEKSQPIDTKNPVVHSKSSSAECPRQSSHIRSPLDTQTRRSFTTVHRWTGSYQAMALWPHGPLPMFNGRSVFLPVCRQQRRFQSTTTAPLTRTRGRPSLKRYSEEEDACLIDSRAAGTPWGKIGLLLDVRGSAACYRFIKLISQEKWLRRYEACLSPSQAPPGDLARFTAQEDAELVRMRKAKRKFREIGDALNRPIYSVSARWYKLRRIDMLTAKRPSQKAGEPPIHANEQRTNEQTQLLLRMKSEGASLQEMARELEMGTALARCILRHLCRESATPWSESELAIVRFAAAKNGRERWRLKTLLPGRTEDAIKYAFWRYGFFALRKWRATDDEKLLRLRESGTPYEKIAQAIGRSHYACQRRFSRLKLQVRSKSDRSDRTKS